MSRIALLIVVLSGACASRDDYSATAGLVCEVMGEAFCGRFDACYGPEEWPECFDGFMDICCRDAGTCNVRATRTTAWADACAAGLWEQTCEWFFTPGATFPEECRL